VVGGVCGGGGVWGVGGGGGGGVLLGEEKLTRVRPAPFISSFFSLGAFVILSKITPTPNGAVRREIAHSRLTWFATGGEAATTPRWMTEDRVQ